MIKLEILSSKCCLKVGVYYCPPDQTYEADFVMEKEIREVTKAKNVIMLGDLNYPHTNWVNMCSNQAILSYMIFKK